LVDYVENPSEKTEMQFKRVSFDVTEYGRPRTMNLQTT